MLSFSRRELIIAVVAQLGTMATAAAAAAVTSLRQLPGAGRQNSPPEKQK